jgi:hypothetical protein
MGVNNPHFLIIYINLNFIIFIWSRGNELVFNIYSMLLSSEIEIKLGTKNFSSLINKYKLSENLGPGEVAKVPVNLLDSGSHYKVKVICDYCGVELEVPYKRYNKSISIIEKYSCSKKDCSNNKIKDVCLKKYGVENPFQHDSFKQKIKKTIKLKYGVEHQMQSEQVKNKIKETCLNKYGVDSYTKTEEYKEKTLQTNNRKFGASHPMLIEEEKLKRKKTRISNGNQIPDELLSPYQIYRSLIENHLDRIKNNFLSEWDGFDYYDGEYIKPYMDFMPNNRLYPSIDHKISVYYGFINGIEWSEIADVKNLCVTKSFLNSSKRNLNAEEFIQKRVGKSHPEINHQH